MTQIIGGDLELLEPPGGWVTDHLLDGGTRRVTYSAQDGSKLTLTGHVQAERTLRVPAGEFSVTDVRYTGEALRPDGGGRLLRHDATLTVWYSRQFGRVVAYESRILGNRNLSSVNRESWERGELASHEQ